MKLEVGMYVRLINDVEDIVVINKIANVFETTILTENDGSIYQGEYTKENVVKASYDIIDILEVGDYVNGLKVTSVDKTFEGNELIGLEKNFGISKFDNDYIITSIVTKEQFKNMEYRIGE